MNWHWPQWTLAAIFGFSYLCNLVSVLQRSGFVARIAGLIVLVATAFVVNFILYCGGFWTP